MLDALLAFAEPLRRPIRESGRQYAHGVETRLDVSARHLSVAAFGEQLEPAWQHTPEAGHARQDQLRQMFPGVTHATLATAAQTLVFGNAMIALDLCASAAAWWCDQTKSNDEEFDLSELISRRAKPFQARNRSWVPVWLFSWADSLSNDQRLDRVWTLRDQQTHRVVPRSAVVSLGPPGHARGSAYLSAAPGSTIVADDHANAVGMAEEHWRSLWSALAASA